MVRYFVILETGRMLRVDDEQHYLERAKQCYDTVEIVNGCDELWHTHNQRINRLEAKHIYAEQLLRRLARYTRNERSRLILENLADLCRNAEIQTADDLTDKTIRSSWEYYH